MSDLTTIDDDGRQTEERRDERAKWTRDIAEIFRGMTASPEYAAYRIAADFLDPPLAAPTSPSEPVPPTPRVIGYVVVIQDSTGHWADDWDGVVHETLEKGLTALAEARESGDGFHAKLGLLTEVEETNDG